MNKATAKKKSKSRVWEVDFFRGLAILLVIWDHTMVDLAIFYQGWRGTGVNWLIKWGYFGIDYLQSYVRFFWRPVFLFIFFIASGISTAFSKNNFTRGLKLVGVSLAVSIITYLLSSWTGGDYFVKFGVLHCMAVIILIYTLIAFIIDKVSLLISSLTKKVGHKELSRWIITICCFILSIVFYCIDKKYNLSLYDLERRNAYMETNSRLLGLFFYMENWSSADYFPLFPFISYFFLGAGLANILYAKKKTLLPSLDGKWHKPITLFGRYSLIVYLSIQIVLFAFFALLTYIAAGIFII